MNEENINFKLIGIVFVSGFILAVILIQVLGFKPTNFGVGPVEFEIPTLQPTSTIGAAVAQPEITMQSTSIVVAATQPEVTTQPSNLIKCSGNDWENCWVIDDINKTLTWVGIQDATADIGQSNHVLEKIRAGYMAVFTIEEAMKINICTGKINGKFVSGSCPIIINLPSGTYQVSSPGASGGFRVTRDGK